MRPALLLVDLQKDFLESPGLQPAADAIINGAGALLAACRRQKVPVIHIWTTLKRGEDRRLPHWKKTNRWLCVAGTPGHETPARLRPLDGDIVIHKRGFNSFAGGGLDNALQKLKCDTVLMAGIHLHTCVRTAATESLERSLSVFVCDDAIGSNDPIHAASVRRWLADRCVRFETADALAGLLEGHAAATWVHHSPRNTESALFKVASADIAEISGATTAAREASETWRRSPLTQRRRMLTAVATELEKAAPQLARQMAIEIGKPISHGFEEVRRAAANIRDVIRRAKDFRHWESEAKGAVRHEPLGVVALISPWNNPVAIPVGKLAPALMFGNTVVWKPAPAATRIARAVLRLFHRCGVPRDAIKLVPGGPATAQSLAADPGVDAVTLTGSARAGYALQEICARRAISLQAELSGNNAAIVWDDADLAHAATQIAWGAFGFAGQRCTANRRVIVSHAQFENLWRELKQATQSLVLADPLKTKSDLGPVIESVKRDEVFRVLEVARANAGAHRIELTHEAEAGKLWFRRGAYVQPAIVGCDHPGHTLVQEETMAPLLVVQRADDFDQALELCNGVRHGLAAALFTESADLRRKFLAGAQAGILKFNASTAGADVSLPFGGWKASGIGPPEHGPGDRIFYTRMQAVYGMRAPGSAIRKPNRKPASTGFRKPAL